MMKVSILSWVILAALAVSPAESLFAAEAPKAKDTPKEAVAASPETDKKSSIYEYTGVGRRDPFTSLIQKKTSDKEKGASALESYDTADMKLIAVLWEKSRYYAVVSLPDGKSYTVYEGVKIGLSSGVIRKISKDTMVISEKFKDARGRINPRERVLKLRMEEE